MKMMLEQKRANLARDMPPLVIWGEVAVEFGNVQVFLFGRGHILDWFHLVLKDERPRHT